MADLHSYTGDDSDVQGSERPAIDPDASSDVGDFADEHNETSTERQTGDHDGEAESPRGRSGLEPTARPN